MTWKWLIGFVSPSNENLYPNIRDFNDNKQIKSRLCTSLDESKDKQYTQEMLEIKRKAIENGTFMKAPNGQPTNQPDERHWLIIRTEGFKARYGNWENFAPTVSLTEKMHMGTSGTHFYEYTINNSEGNSEWHLSISVDTKTKIIEIQGIEATKGKGLWRNSLIALQLKFRDYTINSTDSLTEDWRKMWENMVRNDMAIKNDNNSYTFKLEHKYRGDENGEPIAWNITL